MKHVRVTIDRARGAVRCTFPPELAPVMAEVLRKAGRYLRGRDVSEVEVCDALCAALFAATGGGCVSTGAPTGRERW